MPSLPSVQYTGCRCRLNSAFQAALSAGLTESTLLMTRMRGLMPHHSGICLWQVAWGILRGQTSTLSRDRSGETLSSPDRSSQARHCEGHLHGGNGGVEMGRGGGGHIAGLHGSAPCVPDLKHHIHHV